MRKLRSLGFNKGLLVALSVSSLFIASCSTNPATGKKQFTAFMPASNEASVGAEENAKVRAQYGIVTDSDVNAMVTAVGNSLTPYTERSDVHYTFTVLDSPEVNAFALPGGYVYVTRGLLALANNEAELAAVIGHEIGHVTARHSAERYSRSVATGLGASILGVLLDTQGATDLLGLGSNLYLASYSRTQEHQADSLGIRYITRAGYDPYAMTSFLTSLERQTELRSKEMGAGASKVPSYFSTHPVTQERVSKTLTEAGQVQYNDHARVNHEGYLNAIQGLVYGDSPDQGFVSHGRFVHPKLGFMFDIPSGFTVDNGLSEIAVVSGRSDAVALADMASLPSGMTAETYMRTVWMKNQPASPIETRTVNGAPAAFTTRSGTLNGKPVTLLLAAIQHGGNAIFRFHLAIPQNTPQADINALKAMAESFRAPTPSELAAAKPMRIVVFESSGIQSISQAASKMPFDDGLNELRFRVLNGMSSSDSLQKGGLYKTIVQ